MDCITFGESMILFNPSSNGALKYVHTYHKSIAGAESNLAIALARLGHKVGWFSQLGHDEFGRYIKSVITGEGVDTSQVKFDNQHPTGLLFKERFQYSDPNVYYYRHNSAASHMNKHLIDPDYISKSRILHLTGITAAISHSSREALLHSINIARKTETLISFDPNIRLKLWNLVEARQVLIEISKKADIVFPGIKEGEQLFGLTSPKDIANAFLKLGCKVVSVKLGKDGCYTATKDTQVYVPGYPVENVVDTVGAGDGFAAGFLSGYLRGQDLKSCSKLANAVGAMATMVSGDMEGYPTLEQVNGFIGKSKSIDR